MAWEPISAFADGAILTVGQMNRLQDGIRLTEAAVLTAAGQMFVSDGVNSVRVITPTPNLTVARILTMTPSGETSWTDVPQAGPSDVITAGRIPDSARAAALIDDLTDGSPVTWRILRSVLRTS